MGKNTSVFVVYMITAHRARGYSHIVKQTSDNQGPGDVLGMT